jgi:uncharacterized protein (DUF433 family)
MALTLAAEPMPLTKDEHGSIRVGNTRVLLEFVIHAFQAGASAEEIARRFDSLERADVYAVLAYYLRHRDEVDEYMRCREAEAAETRRQIESDMPQRVSREELNARWAKRQES